MIFRLIWNWICNYFLARKAKDKQKKEANKFLAKSNIITVYIGGHFKKRALVAAELVKSNIHTIWVRLFDGNLIKRKRKRDLPKEEK